MTRETLIVQATKQEQAGRYMVLIKATLDNVLSSQAQITFILNVLVNKEETYVAPQLPAPSVKLYVHN